MNKKLLSFIIVCIGVYLVLTLLFFSIFLSIYSHTKEKEVDGLLDKLTLLKENYLQVGGHLDYLNKTCGSNLGIDTESLECSLECLSDYEPLEHKFTLIPVGGFMWGY